MFPCLIHIHPRPPHHSDLESTSTAPIFSAPKAHSSVYAIDGCGGGGVGHGAPELVTGGMDGRVCVWDPRVAGPVLVLEPLGVGAGTAGQVRDASTSSSGQPSQLGESAALQASDIPFSNSDSGSSGGSSSSSGGSGKAPGTGGRECWTVAFGNSFNDDNRVVAAGYDNGDIKLFDLRTSRMLWEDNTGNGVVSLEFDRWGRQGIVWLERRRSCVGYLDLISPLATPSIIFE